MERWRRTLRMLAPCAAMTLIAGCGALTPRNFRAMNNPAPVVRAGAVGLGDDQPDSVAIPAWIKSLDDKDSVVRMNANNGLRKRHGPGFRLRPLGRSRGAAPGRRSGGRRGGSRSSGAGRRRRRKEGWSRRRGNSKVRAATDRHRPRRAASNVPRERAPRPPIPRAPPLRARRPVGPRRRPLPRRAGAVRPLGVPLDRPAARRGALAGPGRGAAPRSDLPLRPAARGDRPRRARLVHGHAGVLRRDVHGRHRAGRRRRDGPERRPADVGDGPGGPRLGAHSRPSSAATTATRSTATPRGCPTARSWPTTTPTRAGRSSRRGLRRRG